MNSKFELRRLCNAVGATPLVRLGKPVPGEGSGSLCVSVWCVVLFIYCCLAFQRRLATALVCRCVSTGPQTLSCSSRLLSKVLFVVCCELVFCFDGVGNVCSGSKSLVGTIVIRGATMNILDDIERAIDDGVRGYKVCYCVKFSVGCPSLCVHRYWCRPLFATSVLLQEREPQKCIWLRNSESWARAKQVCFCCAFVLCFSFGCIITHAHFSPLFSIGAVCHSQVQ